MRTFNNAALQFAVLACFIALRLSTPGWWLVIFVGTVVGPLLALVPIITAVVTVRRGRHRPAVQAPYLACAVTLVTTGALFPDFGDVGGWRVPILHLFAPRAEYPEATVLALGTVGEVAAVAYVASLAWLVVALMLTARTVDMTRYDSYPGSERPAGL